MKNRVHDEYEEIRMILDAEEENIDFPDMEFDGRTSISAREYFTVRFLRAAKTLTPKMIEEIDQLRAELARVSAIADRGIPNSGVHENLYGEKFIRDPESRCSMFADYLEMATVQGGTCMSDGHHLCKSCVHLDIMAAKRDKP